MTKNKHKKIKIKKMDRECWNLNISFAKWLEPRLKLYLKRGGKIVDLDFYKFAIDGIEKTQREWIETMIDLCSWINNDDNFLDDKFTDKLLFLGKIWATVLPSMWW